MFISKSPVHTYRASLEDLEKKTFKKSRSHFLTRKFMIFPYFFRNYVIIFEPMPIPSFILFNLHRGFTMESKI